MHHFKHNQLRTLIILGLSLGGGLNPSPSYASNLTIKAVFDASITNLSNALAVESTINTAILNLENDVTTRAPVNLTFDFKSINTDLATNVTPEKAISYSTYLGLLQSNPDQTSNLVTALNSLPTGLTTGINNNASQVILTAANLLALGYTQGVNIMELLNGGFDSIINLNLSAMNISRPDTNSAKYDLESIVMHELTEALGIGGRGSSLNALALNGTAPTNIGPLDLYRYSAPGVRSYTTSANAVSYFSIDGGVTKLVNFNQQGGGATDYGDWGTTSQPQVQNAYETPGTAPDLGPNEITALNVIGYNLTPAGKAADGLTATVPSPAPLWLIVSGWLAMLRFKNRKSLSYHYAV